MKYRISYDRMTIMNLHVAIDVVRPSNSLDQRGGSVFRTKRSAGKVALSRPLGQTPDVGFLVIA